MFQTWVATIKTGQMIFGDFPKVGKGGVVFDKDNVKLVNDRIGTTVWEYSRWVPDSVEKKFYIISQIRGGSIHSGGNTLIDKKYLTSVNEFIFYLPRAFQIGLFSPFPQFWSGEGTTPAMTMARKIVGIATLFFYFCFFCLCGAIISHRKNTFFCMTLVFCIVGILLYSYVSVNTGTIMRTRYGFYMLFVSFGFAHLVQLLQSYLKNRDKKREFDN